MRAVRWLSWAIGHPLAGVYGTPIVGAVALYFAITGPGWWNDFFLDHGLGFLISFWIGSGFSYVWWMLRQGAADIPGGEVTAALIGIVGIVLVAGAAVVVDPWLFGISIWPGLTMLLPSIERRLAGGGRP